MEVLEQNTGESQAARPGIIQLQRDGYAAWLSTVRAARDAAATQQVSTVARQAKQVTSDSHTMARRRPGRRGRV